MITKEQGGPGSKKQKAVFLYGLRLCIAFGSVCWGAVYPLSLCGLLYAFWFCILWFFIARNLKPVALCSVEAS
jgi:hypothetical protein